MEVRRLSAPPSEGALYTRAVLGAVRGGGGRRSRQVPAVEIRLADVPVDRARLATYDNVCGFRLTDTLPATYPHVLAFPVSMQLMTDAEFPFPVLGLVHIGNRIAQVRPIRADQRLGVAVRADNLRPHPSGTQIDLICEVSVDGELVWSEVSTYLSRGGAGPGGPAERPAGDDTDTGLAPVGVWQLPADIGRRYAAVSGDRNPIHLSSVGARLFGFRRAIAHGMWTKAHCLAVLEGRLPSSYTVEVRFKRPILLPARVTFAVQESAGAGRRFEVRDARTSKPHLLGVISPS